MTVLQRFWAFTATLAACGSEGPILSDSASGALEEASPVSEVPPMDSSPCGSTSSKAGLTLARRKPRGSFTSVAQGFLRAAL